MQFSSIVESMMLNILQRRGKPCARIEPDKSLFENGLDSLDIAELSVNLEQQFGHDPYSNGVFPRSLQQICAYYEEKLSTL